MTFTVARVPVLTDNYVWLAHDDASGETAVIDPAVADPVLAAAAERGWTITQIWNTHWHPDHTGGNEHLAGSGSVLVAHDNVRARLSEPQTVAAYGLEVPAAAAGAESQG